MLFILFHLKQAATVIYEVYRLIYSYQAHFRVDYVVAKFTWTNRISLKLSKPLS